MFMFRWFGRVMFISYKLVDWTYWMLGMSGYVIWS